MRVPWTARRSNQSILKEISPEFIGRADAEAPILQPSDVKIQLIGKDPDDRKDQRQKEKGAAENAMGRQYHQLNQHEFEQTSGESEE